MGGRYVMSILLLVVGGRAGGTSILTALDGSCEFHQIILILLYFSHPRMSPSGLLSTVILAMALVLGSAFDVGRIAKKQFRVHSLAPCFHFAEL